MTQHAEITRVIGYVGRATTDRRTLTSVWFSGQTRGVYHDQRIIGSLLQVRFQTNGRIVGQMHLGEPEPQDAWPVLHLRSAPNDGDSYRRGRWYMSGEIVVVTYTEVPAWRQLKEEPR